MKKYLIALMVVGMSLLSFTTAETSTFEVENTEINCYFDTVDVFVCSCCNHTWSYNTFGSWGCPMPAGCPSCKVGFVNTVLWKCETNPITDITTYTWWCINEHGAGGDVPPQEIIKVPEFGD